MLELGGVEALALHSKKVAIESSGYHDGEEKGATGERVKRVRNERTNEREMQKKEDRMNAPLLSTWASLLQSDPKENYSVSALQKGKRDPWNPLLSLGPCSFFFFFFFVARWN